jgi:hypothetical protein
MGGGLMMFRVFTNDRGKERGVPMYSCYTAFSALDIKTAEALAATQFEGLGSPEFAPVKVIEWPPISQTSKDWLAKHVG